MALAVAAENTGTLLTVDADEFRLIAEQFMQIIVETAEEKHGAPPFGAPH